MGVVDYLSSGLFHHIHQLFLHFSPASWYVSIVPYQFFWLFPCPVGISQQSHTNFSCVFLCPVGISLQSHTNLSCIFPCPVGISQQSDTNFFSLFSDQLVIHTFPENNSHTTSYLFNITNSPHCDNTIPKKKYSFPRSPPISCSFKRSYSCHMPDDTAKSITIQTQPLPPVSMPQYSKNC